MSLYDDNLKLIQNYAPDLHQVLIEHTLSETIGVGDAFHGGNYLVIERNDITYMIGSGYDPVHEAERFCEQFASTKVPLSIVLFGFGLGYIAEKLLNSPEICERIYIYEPSIDLFQAAMQLRDQEQVLTASNAYLYVGADQEKKLWERLREDITFHNWNEYQYSGLVNYTDLYEDVSQKFITEYRLIQKHKQIDFNTLVLYSKSSVINEIHFFRYLLRAKSLYDLKPYIQTDIPCIIVAAGPSLEKNVGCLKEAKGRALIFCVDRAARFLISHDIRPDMICTIDADKPEFCLDDERLQGIPIAIISESNYKLLDRQNNPEVMVFGQYPTIHESILTQLGVESHPIDLGGSVALCEFMLAVELGFRTIILIGQDLAYGSEYMHAGETDRTESRSDYWVEGYYDDLLPTCVEFKAYIEVYEGWVPQLTDRCIVNATEGGAKLRGMLQMPLKEAIDRFCTGSFNFREIYEDIPYIIKNEFEWDETYQSLEKHVDEIAALKPLIQKALDQTKGELRNIGVGIIRAQQLEYVNRYNDRILDTVRQCEASDMLYRCMMQTEETIADSLGDGDSDPIEEIKALYRAMIDYMAELSDVVDLLLETWEDVLTRMKDTNYDRN